MCKRNIIWLSLVRPLLGTLPATQACALTGNRSGNLLVHRPALSPLSYTSQGPTCQLSGPVFIYLVPFHYVSSFT